jgi:cold-inducible RNA-binding protein
MGRKLYVGNLPFSATEADLRSKFEQFGTVESAFVATDARTGRSRRFGFVEMSSDTDAQTAVKWLNMTQYDEATISVRAARLGEAEQEK